MLLGLARSFARFALLVRHKAELQQIVLPSAGAAGERERYGKHLLTLRQPGMAKQHWDVHSDADS